MLDRLCLCVLLWILILVCIRWKHQAGFFSLLPSGRSIGHPSHYSLSVMHPESHQCPVLTYQESSSATVLYICLYLTHHPYFLVSCTVSLPVILNPIPIPPRHVWIGEWFPTFFYMFLYYFLSRSMNSYYSSFYFILSLLLQERQTDACSSWTFPEVVIMLIVWAMCISSKNDRQSPLLHTQSVHKGQEHRESFVLNNEEKPDIHALNWLQFAACVIFSFCHVGEENYWFAEQPVF